MLPIVPILRSESVSAGSAQSLSRCRTMKRENIKSFRKNPTIELLPCLIGFIFALTQLFYAMPIFATNVNMNTASEQFVGIEFSLEMVVDNVNDIYGAAFDLIYDPEFLDVVDADVVADGVQPKVSEGELLNNAGIDTTFLRSALEDEIPGTIVMGISRSGAVIGADTSTDNVILSVSFLPKQEGTTSIIFDQQGLKTSDNSNIPVDSWNGVTITIDIFEETFYQDGDSDGYGDPDVSTVSDVMPEGYVRNNLDCDDNDPDINPDAEEICDSKDNNCDSIVDGENAVGCTTYYKDGDEDGSGDDEDYRCLCTPDLDGKYTTILPGDPDDSDPEAKGSYIAVNMVLAAGWNMISLPVVPIDPTIQILFPEAIAVFEFTTMYELRGADDTLDASKGYWLYLPEAKTYSIVGLPIDYYTLPDMGAAWSMIGACSYPSRVSVSSGTIRAVFGFSTKYDLIGSGNNVGLLEPGKGYWINLSEQADIIMSSE